VWANRPKRTGEMNQPDEAKEIDDQREPPNLSPARIAEIERRLAAYERDPSSGVPWEEARARLRARYG